jgi:hypothetical protein
MHGNADGEAEDKGAGADRHPSMHEVSPAVVCFAWPSRLAPGKITSPECQAVPE